MSLTNRNSGTHFLTLSAYNRFRMFSSRRSNSSISDAESIQSSLAAEEQDPAQPNSSFSAVKMMGDGVKTVLTKPLMLADQVTKWADDAYNFKQKCIDLKSKTEKLAALLRQAASVDLYERPTRRIMDDTEQVLEKALALVSKCRNNGVLKRVFTIIPQAAFKKMSTHLDNSVGDVSWLLRVSAGVDMHLGLPPIAQNEPILFLIWEQIATLHTGNHEARSDAAASLVSLARDNERHGKLIIEEDGVGPLLRLMKDRQIEGQENAARAIGLLGRDPESVEQMVLAGVARFSPIS